MEKILIISVSGIGNTIMQSPFINHLLNQKGYCVDILFGNGAMECVFKGDERLRKTFVLPHKTLKAKISLIRELSKERYDYTIACFPSNRMEFHLLPYIIGSKNRIIHRYSIGRLKTLSFLSNVKVEVNKDLHDVEQNLNLLTALRINPDTAVRKLLFATSPEDKAYAKQYITAQGLENKLIVGMHPGTKGTESYRRWPADKFIELVTRLNKQNIQCLLFAGPEEITWVEKIYKAVKSTHKNFIVIEKDINNVAAIISYCRVFLSTDSGLGHIAVAKGVPTYAIFGPAQSGRTGPYGPQGHVISLNLHCSPCLKYPFQSTHSTINCPYNFKCLNNLAVDQVQVCIQRHI